MRFFSRMTASAGLALMLGGGSAAPVLAQAAQDHLVPLQQLQQNAQTAAEQRQKDIADIERVLSYPAAQEALAKANVNQQQMKQAVATLDNQELARLANQARVSENDVKGGLIVGILALIGLIVVIIIVVAVFA